MAKLCPKQLGRALDEFDKKYSKNIPKASFSEEVVRLAELVVKMPPMPDTAEAIEQWAKTLAADICKGRD